MARKFWTCPKGCGGRWERSLVKCRTEGCTGRRPKARVPKHARTLRDDPYPVYEAVNAELHAGAFGGEWTPDCCGVCGKPPTTERHMDRDHDHKTGLPRGLACPGNQGCNALMPSWMTPERADQITAYLRRAAYYRQGGGRVTLREPPAGLAAAASFGCLLEDAEQGALADWTMDLGAFVQRIAALDPRRGPVDTHQMVEDAKALLEAGKRMPA